jgi:hypothetical protein
MELLISITHPKEENNMVQCVRDYLPGELNTEQLLEKLGCSNRLDEHALQSLIERDLDTEDASDRSNPDSEFFIAPGEQFVVRDGQRGVSFDRLFGECFEGANRIEVQDPHIEEYYQARNLQELVETTYRFKSDNETVYIRLITSRPDMDDQRQRQEENLVEIREKGKGLGIHFSWKFATDRIHDRYVTTDTGWKIVLGRGLDMFKYFHVGDVLDPKARIQELRESKAFEVTYLRPRQVKAREQLAPCITTL